MQPRFAVVLFIAVFITSCTKSPGSSEQALKLSVAPVPNPAGPDSSLPHLDANHDLIIMSWVSRQTSDSTKTHLATLRFSHFSDADWTTPLDIASGDNWFVNWADFPAVSIANDATYFAHWLVRSGESTYAYDVVAAQSVDGRDWLAPRRPHQDKTQTEHGFASHFDLDGKPALVWLDGRNTAAQNESGTAHSSHSDHEGGPMTLRVTHTLPDKTRFAASTEIDNKVCDCCQTSAVNTSNGPIIFYRDRSDEEIRDIAYVRWLNGRWSSPAILHNDNWRITGCPVNGPQADAIENSISVAWFTAATEPLVKLSSSFDGGASFSSPITLNQSTPLGRVEVVQLTEQRAMVMWMESTDNTLANIQAQLFENGKTASNLVTVSTVDASRRSGFPRAERISDASVLIAWTEFSADAPKVATATIAVTSK